MKDIQTQKGFTLVELAIVMTIIGLLIGGILKGQELMANARITATIAQVRAFEAATTTFRDKYDAVPGDMANANVRLPGCTGTGIDCNPAAAANNATPGDNIVGRNDYTTNATAPWASQTNATSVPGTTTASAGVSYETTLFWAHLLVSDLISGVTNAAVVTSTPAPAAAWGDSHPGAKAGGGFVVGYGGGRVTPGSAGATGTGPTGMILVLVSTPTTGGLTAMVAPGTQPLTPTRAAQMDRKMDDGRPTAGFVQAYGQHADGTTLTDGCTSEAAPFSAVSPGYLESSTNLNCGLVFRIQG